MRIPDEVEQVRHFIAGHEFRNSFPGESIHFIDSDTGKATVRANFIENVHGGVHSDVGGGYRPGEGGKGNDPTTKLGLVYLHKMHEYAIKAEVPLLGRDAMNSDSKEDFMMDAQVWDDYAYYLSKVTASHLTIGNLILAHMRLYYQWRFHVINRKFAKNQSEAKAVKTNADVFAKEERRLTNDVARYEREYADAQKKVSSLLITHRQTSTYGMHASSIAALQKKFEAELKSAKTAEMVGLDTLRRTQARLLTLPKEQELPAYIDYYDAQLYKDAQAVLDVVMSPETVYKARFIHDRAALRPHYKILVEAYENEFLKNKGLTDKRIIDFFDKYVHNSLAPFAKDATLPSDPRVIFCGLDYRVRFADAATVSNNYAV